MVVGEGSIAREGGPAAAAPDERDMGELQNPHDPQLHQHQHQQQHQQHHLVASTAFHISRPTPPISAIITPPPLHNTSVILGEDAFHVPRSVILPNDNFQVTQKQNHFFLTFSFYNEVGTAKRKEYSKSYSLNSFHYKIVSNLCSPVRILRVNQKKFIKFFLCILKIF